MSSPEQSALFISVIQENKGIIYKVASAYCPDPEDRKDLAQEIIIQLWRSFGSYSNQYKYSTWMYRISLNVAISFYRKDRRRKEISDPLKTDVLDFVDRQATEENEEKINLLQRFISELKELDKALMLLYLEEKTNSEIAGILGISETNVTTKISRIKMIIKQKFSNLKA